MRRMALALAALLFMMAFVQACSSPTGLPPPAAGSGDAAFRQLAGEIIEYTYKRNPSNATNLGIHKYDDLIADYSAVAVTADTEAIKAFRTRLDDVDAEALSLEAQLDLERTKQTLDGMLLRNDVIRRWAKDPDLYSSGITNDAFVMISRTFAPPEQRLRAGSPGRDDSTGQYLTRASSIEASVGFDHDTVQRALRALNTQPSFFEKVTEVSGGEIVMVGPPTGSALRVAGAWPSPENLLERLIAALENAADDEMRAPDERSKLKQAATWLASFGSQIAISALGGAAGNVLSS